MTICNIGTNCWSYRSRTAVWIHMCVCGRGITDLRQHIQCIYQKRGLASGQTDGQNPELHPLQLRCSIFGLCLYVYDSLNILSNFHWYLSKHHTNVSDYNTIIHFYDHSVLHKFRCSHCTIFESFAIARITTHLSIFLVGISKVNSCSVDGGVIQNVPTL